MRIAEAVEALAEHLEDDGFTVVHKGDNPPRVAARKARWYHVYEFSHYDWRSAVRQTQQTAPLMDYVWIVCTSRVFAADLRFSARWHGFGILHFKDGRFEVIDKPSRRENPDKAKRRQFLGVESNG